MSTRSASTLSALPQTEPILSGTQSATAPSRPDADSFAPPADYEFEPELRGETPRPIPSFDRPGRLERRRKTAFLSLLTVGSLSLVLAPLPVVQEIGQYFLPLAWLAWIGGGCLVLAAGSYVWQFVSPGPYRYIREGVPIVARLAALAKAPTAELQGQPTQFAYVGIIEFPDPRFGELRQLPVRSNPLPAHAKDDYATTFQPGDYVTAIYLPRQLEKSIRLYGFLDLNPEIGLLRRGRSAPAADLWKVPLSVAAIVGIFAVLCWNVYAWGRFQPIELTFSQQVWPLAIGGVVLGGGMLALLGMAGGLRVGKAAAAVLVFGSLVLGGMTTLCWCCTYNALADNLPGRDQPVVIKEFWQTTHNGVFREYTIEYVFPGSDRTYKLMTNPDHMACFEVPLGAAEVHDGRLGWKWVKTIRPLGAADFPAE